MERTMTASVELLDLVAQMKAAEESFVLATVVRTVSVTAAKAGAKAIIRPDGSIVAGWIGGGCARGAVLKAGRDERGHRLRLQHVPEQGHHGYFRRTRAAASGARHSRRKPGRVVARRASPHARLSCHTRSAGFRPSGRASRRHADRFVRARRAA